MKKNIALFLLITIGYLFGGCGYQEGVRTPAPQSYLYFTGESDDITISVDNSIPFEIKTGKEHLYKIEPGKHTVIIYKNNTPIKEHNIYVGDGISKEIKVQ